MCEFACTREGDLNGHKRIHNDEKLDNSDVSEYESST